MRQTRRNLLLGGAGLLATGLAGYGVSARTERTTSGRTAVDDGSSIRPQATAAEMDEAVAYARAAEEVKGHLASSAELLARERREDAALHAGHASDYFAALLTPLRDEDPDQATRLRATLRSPGERVRSSGAEAYRTYVTDEVFPAVDRAVETVVPDGLRSTAAFDVRVMNALAGRIAEEYSAAVDASGTIQLAGEYWDGRGFLSRIERRHERVGSALDGAGGETLATLRSQMEAVESPSAVRATTLRFRVETTAAGDLPAARIEGRDDALAYVRNLEEVRGHLAASTRLVAAGDASAAGLHAGHGSDYVTALLPAVQRADPELAEQLMGRLLGLDGRVDDGPAAFERYVDEQVVPLLDRVDEQVVPDEYAGETSFDAAVFLALARRIEDEYTAAVSEDEVIELYGEYWDARGFLTRIEARFAEIEGDLDGEVRAEVSEELDILRTELETAATPADVAGSIAALERELGDVADS